MILASITRTKNHLSALLDKVKAGNIVVITERDRPVARIEPITQGDNTSSRVQQLARRGVLRLGAGEMAPSILEAPPICLRCSVDLAALLDEERADRV